MDLTLRLVGPERQVHLSRCQVTLATAIEPPADQGGMALEFGPVSRRRSERERAESVQIRRERRRLMRPEVDTPSVGTGIGLGAGVGGGLGLVFALLFGTDIPTGLVAGAAIGVLLGLLVDSLYASRRRRV
jgi:hypothetical protein